MRHFLQSVLEDVDHRFIECKQHRSKAVVVVDGEAVKVSDVTCPSLRIVVVVVDLEVPKGLRRSLEDGSDWL